MIILDLKTLMQQRHLSIQDVYEGTGISRNTISQLYNGKSKGIQFETLTKLVDFLNVEVEELFEERADFQKMVCSVTMSSEFKRFDTLKKIPSEFDYRPIAELIFSSPRFVSNEYKIADFRLPVFIEYEENDNSVLFYTDEETAMDYLSEDDDVLIDRSIDGMDKLTKLNSAGKVERMFSQQIFTLFSALKVDEHPTFVGYSNELGKQTHSYLNYLWPGSLVDQSLLNKYIDLKYPYLKDETKLIRYR